jgi:hypothetical protein
MLPGLPGWAQNHPNQLAQLHQKTRMMSQLAHNIEKARMGFHGEVKRDAMAREHQRAMEALQPEQPEQVAKLGNPLAQITPLSGIKNK